jgi:hypothetical protein
MIDALAVLLALVKPYFHPLHDGAWSGRLAQLLLSLCDDLRLRLAGEHKERLRERRWAEKCSSGTDTGAPATATATATAASTAASTATQPPPGLPHTPAPPSRRLSPSQVLRLVHLLTPFALQALYSRSETMTDAGAHALRILAGIAPELVVGASMAGSGSGTKPAGDKSGRKPAGDNKSGKKPTGKATSGSGGKSTPGSGSKSTSGSGGKATSGSGSKVTPGSGSKASGRWALDHDFAHASWSARGLPHLWPSQPPSSGLVALVKSGLGSLTDPHRTRASLVALIACAGHMLRMAARSGDPLSDGVHRESRASF